MPGEERSSYRLMDAVARVAPGTLLRDSLDNILRSRSGALIVVGEPARVLALTDGGFPVDVRMTPQRLYEMAKMDGALVLDQEAQRIIWANTQLLPDPSIPTSESGIKHRAAQRLARQTGDMVICVSRRRNLITLYKGEERHILSDLPVVLARADQALSTLERYRSLLDEAVVRLTGLELEGLVSLRDLSTVIGRSLMIFDLSREIASLTTELGTEGRLARIRCKELTEGVRNELLLLVSDYAQTSRSPEGVMKEIESAPEVLSAGEIARILRLEGAGGEIPAVDSPLMPRGKRILKRIPRIPSSVIDELVEAFDGLGSLMDARPEELERIGGIGTVRAQTIYQGLQAARDTASCSVREIIRRS